MTRRTVRIGCAVSEARVSAVLDGTSAQPYAVDVADGEASLDTRIAAALVEAITSVMTNGRIVAGTRAVVRVALMPALAQVRRVELPPMAPDERARVLSRDAARYFFGVRQPHHAEALPLRGAGPPQVLAAAAPASLMDAIEHALPDGAVIDAFLPAAAAWAASIGGQATIVVDAGSAAIIVECRRGVVANVRHRPASEHASGSRWSAAMALDHAARGAWAADTLLLRSDAQRALLKRARTRRRVGLAAAAALITVIAGAGILFAMNREAVQVRAERAGIAQQVADALMVRDSLEVVNARVASLADLTADAGWSDVLAILSQRLPTDAHIVSMLGAGDSVELRIEAAAAADVVPALREMPLLRNVRLTGAIERETAAPGETRERFSIAARVGQGAVQ